MANQWKLMLGASFSLIKEIISWSVPIRSKRASLPFKTQTPDAFVLEPVKSMPTTIGLIPLAFVLLRRLLILISLFVY